MPTVIQSRGGLVEASFPSSVAVVHAGKTAIVHGGDFEASFRSSAKPFQLAVSLAALGDPDDVADEDLAIGAASHGGEPFHIDRVRRLLERFGLSAEALRCGGHAPSHAPSAEALVRAGEAFSALHNNCSGKHAFMVAACRARGLSLEYLDAAHPYQAEVFERLSGWLGYTPRVATDGCGVPTYFQPLRAMAKSYWTLARAIRAPSGVWDARLARVGLAMSRHPRLTSGTGRLDLDVVTHCREPIVVKVGAAGLFCMALPERDLGMAVRVRAGSMEALPALVSWALQLHAPGAFAPPDAWGPLVVRNVVGREVGGWHVEPD